MNIICLTPVKNEAWILDRFLKSTSLWADYIIIADQMSTDGSQEIAKSYPKVILIDNPDETYNEASRQNLLINEARKIEGPRLLITLDADEIFTPNILSSPEWQTIIDSEPGTIFKFQWANFKPDLQKMWYGAFFPWGYMDDGCDYESKITIHAGRIPFPDGHKVVEVKQIKVIHFQYTNWKRMQTKHAWYQCFEQMNFPGKGALNIFRNYHHMYAIPVNQLYSIPEEWISDYNKLGIDITKVCYETKIWWEEKVLDYIKEYGAKTFRKLRIWDINWQEKAKLWDKTNIAEYKDPRNIIDRIIQTWLLKTQTVYHKRHIRQTERVIRKLFNY